MIDEGERESQSEKGNKSELTTKSFWFPYKTFLLRMPMKLARWKKKSQSIQSRLKEKKKQLSNSHHTSNSKEALRDIK